MTKVSTITGFMVVTLLATTNVNASYVRRTGEESEQTSIHIKIHHYPAKVHSDDAGLVIENLLNDGSVPAWGQCGGTYFDTKACEEGYTCVVITEWFHQCQPQQNRVTRVERWKQCGGENYTGPTECIDGSACKFYSSLYSQCVPG